MLPFNIYATAESSDLIFGTQLGFVKVHHKIIPIRKSSCGFVLGELHEIWGFRFNISAEASDFKFGTQFEFAKAHHKRKPRGKSGQNLGLGELPNIAGSVSYTHLTLPTKRIV